MTNRKRLRFLSLTRPCAPPMTCFCSWRYTISTFSGGTQGCTVREMVVYALPSVSHVLCFLALIGRTNGVSPVSTNPVASLISHGWALISSLHNHRNSPSTEPGQNVILLGRPSSDRYSRMS